MLDLDHIAITVKSLDESIKFYKKFGYKLLDRFSNKEYKWASLKLNDHSLELFQSDNKSFNHIAYSYNSEEEINKLIKGLGYKKLEPFYGDLNRKSFFIEDNNGNQIQLIKK